MQWFLQSSNPDIVKYVRDGTGKGNYKGTNGNQPIATGSNDNYKVNNIYDMAGNCWEWTLEANLTDSRVVHGGLCNHDAASYPASYYSYDYPCLNSYTSISSRATLIM